MKKQDINIIRRIESIEKGSFTEDDIKLLLIEIRERLNRKKFLSEICHFVAHPERNTGISHKKIDVRYAKIKLYEDQTRKELTDEFIETHKDKPERFFTDIMLGYIKTNRIEKNLFDLIILGGLDDLENQLFVQHYRLSKKRVKRLILDSYKIENGYYVIKNNISRTKFLLIDDLLKFIRGTITGKPAFTGEDIAKDLIATLRGLSSELNYQIDMDAIYKNIDDVILTIITLLHDAQFKLFDGEIGRAFLSLHPRGKSSEICLMGKSGKLSMPLIGTNLLANRYLILKNTEEASLGLKEIDWTTVQRSEEGKMYLAENKYQ